MTIESAPEIGPAIDAAGLRMLHAIAERGSITAAADELGTTQPAVSQHLRRVERRAGVSLVVKQGRGVRLTEVGQALAAHGAAVTAAVRAADNDLRAYSGLGKGTVRLLAFPSSSATIVPRALAALAAASPGIRVRLDEAEPAEALEQVRAGACDVALVFGYETPDDLSGLSVTPLLDDPTYVALPRDHPRASGELALGDLAGETWIAGCPRCRGNLTASAQACGFDPQIWIATDDYVAVLEMVSAGIGVALLPGLVRPTALRHPGVVVRTADGAVGRSVSAVTSPELLRQPAVAAVVAALVAASKEITAAAV